MEIRDEAEGEAAEIGRLVAAAFAGDPRSDGGEVTLVARLREAGALTLSLVAAEDGRLSGHVAASPVRLSGARGWMGIAPVSVRPEAQGRGLGSALMRAALARLEADGAKGAVLVGDPGFYARFGFATRDGLIVAGIPQSHVLGLAFGSRPPPRGAVSYHPAFGLG